MSHHSDSHRLLQEAFNQVGGKYQAYVGHYEKADTICQGFYLTGPGLESHYSDGKAMFGYITLMGLDDDNAEAEFKDVDMSGAAGATAVTPEEFKEFTGYDLTQAVEMVKKQQPNTYAAVDLSEHKLNPVPDRKFQWIFAKSIPKDIQARIAAKLMPHGQPEWVDDNTLQVIRPEDPYSTDAHIRILMGMSGGHIRFERVP